MILAQTIVDSLAHTTTMRAQPMIDSLAHAATDTGIPDAGLRISIGVVATFLLAVAGLLLLLKAREADQAVNEISEKSGK